MNGVLKLARPQAVAAPDRSVDRSLKVRGGAERGPRFSVTWTRTESTDPDEQGLRGVLSIDALFGDPVFIDGGPVGIASHDVRVIRVLGELLLELADRVEADEGRVGVSDGVSNDVGRAKAFVSDGRAGS